LKPRGCCRSRKRQRLQIILARDAEGACLQGAVFHQDVAQAKAGLLDDLLEQDRGIDLGGERADVVDRYRLADASDDVGVGLEIATQGNGECRRVGDIGGGLQGRNSGHGARLQFAN
jgi:hypothetical protein